MLSDHDPKYLLTMDNDSPVSYNGIRQRYALDWVLKMMFAKNTFTITKHLLLHEKRGIIMV